MKVAASLPCKDLILALQRVVLNMFDRPTIVLRSKCKYGTVENDKSWAGVRQVSHHPLETAYSPLKRISTLPILQTHMSQQCADKVAGQTLPGGCRAR